MVNTIRYFSTNQSIFGSTDLESRIADGSLETVGLAEAIITGQAPDGGLFMPTHFPSIDASRIQRMKNMEYWQVFVEVMGGFFDGVLSRKTLERIAQEAYTFAPFIETISDADYIVRLDEGPTEAFKDYAAQVLFRVIEALTEEEPQTEVEFREQLKDIKLLTYIVATSGDTGGAMGHACLDRENMWMVILHSAYIPQEVTELQAKQMSNLGNNIHPLWIKTDFDGCQKLAQDLQSDPELKYMNITSANSIDIGRLIPQIAYYFSSYATVAQEPREMVYFSVPSGNFGNAVAGLFAIQMGLPAKLIIGVNENDVFERFYREGIYAPAHETHSSPSNSMNVNWPSNMRRLVQLYGGQLVEGEDPDNPNKKIIEKFIVPNLSAMRAEIVGSFSISDEETHRIIKDFYYEGRMIGDIHSTIEPHGAVAWGATQRFRQETGYNGKVITFETAHPGKFPENLPPGIEIRLPDSLKRLVHVGYGEHSVLENNYGDLKSIIRKLYVRELGNK